MFHLRYPPTPGMVVGMEEANRERPLLLFLGIGGVTLLAAD